MTLLFYKAVTAGNKVGAPRTGCLSRAGRLWPEKDKIAHVDLDTLAYPLRTDRPTPTKTTPSRPPKRTTLPNRPPASPHPPTNISAPKLTSSLSYALCPPPPQKPLRQRSIPTEQKITTVPAQ